jgi:chemotaxis protein MotB
MEKGAQPIIIIKKKGHGHGHHGGGWKVALADFMTAMMAFFLLMWLMGSTNKDEQRAISGFFTDPTSQYNVGTGGVNAGLVEMDRPLVDTSDSNPMAEKQNNHDEIADNTQSGNAAAIMDIQAKKEAERIEKEQLDGVQAAVEAQIKENEVFQEIKDQILIDYTALGLRIQIVDQDKRPMFDSGSAHLKSYSEAVLNALAPLLNKVQNKISVTGHTDSSPYGAGAAYTNWELSADRANSARRALLAGGYPEYNVATVQGMGSASPFLLDKPEDPINRRIAIIVLKKTVSEALSNGGRGIDSKDFILSSDEANPHIMTQKEVDEATDAAQ